MYGNWFEPNSPTLKTLEGPIHENYFLAVVHAKVTATWVSSSKKRRTFLQENATFGENK